MVAWLLVLMNWQPLKQTLFRAWLSNVQATEVNKAAENQALLTGKDARDEFNNDLIVIICVKHSVQMFVFVGNGILEQIAMFCMKLLQSHSQFK